MTKERGATGRSGEDLAAAYLARRGYRVLRRNYRCSIGELDIIAADGDTLVFVEVRTRHTPCAVLPEQSVDAVKMRKLVRLADYYIASEVGEDRLWRVDVVAVELSREGMPIRIELFKNAYLDVMWQR